MAAAATRRRDVDVVADQVVGGDHRLARRGHPARRRSSHGTSTSSRAACTAASAEGNVSMSPSPRRLTTLPPAAAHDRADDLVVVGQEVAGGLVAVAGRVAGEPLEVGEHHRHR